MTGNLPLQSPDRPNLSRVTALLRAGKLAEAEASCREVLQSAPRNAAAVHLLGLIRKDAGDVLGGERLLRESIALQPRSGDFYANLANLLHRTGRVHEAIQCYQQALTLSPAHRAARLGLARTLHNDGQHGEAEQQCRLLISAEKTDAQAWNTLAAILRDQHRLADAEAAYANALRLAPNYATAHHNLGSLLSRLDRPEEALESLNRAQSLGVRGFELAFNRGRVLAQLYRTAEAEQEFAKAVAINPAHGEAQLNLAGLRYALGDPRFTRDITAAALSDRDNPALQILFSTVLRRAGNLPAAEGVLRELIARRGSLPEARSALAQVLRESGRLKEAETEATKAAAIKPGDTAIIETLVCILLSLERPEDAVPFIRMQRARFPNEQGWIAYEATAARLLGETRYGELYDYSRLVRAYDIEPPAGWSSIEELNAALLQALSVRHPFANHPLDQSLRNGSQTARSLLTETEAAIQSVLKAFQAPIEQYRQAIGTDPAHPLSARNRGAVRLSGAWSVQLRRGGFHVNHVHPHGWISSAYYVAVPDEISDLDSMSGWLKFGEPAFPVRGATPEVFVTPRPGRVVLFPSYMWHGTNPIHGNDVRVTIAFDAVPSATP